LFALSFISRLTAALPRVRLPFHGSMKRR